MKIKYINEVTYCCDRMENYMEKTSYIYVSDSKVFLDINFYANKVLIDYCPFCGEKIEFI